MSSVLRRDRRLAARLHRGDVDAWRELCERYGQALYLYAYHRCRGDRSAAEDVRQETLVAAADGIGRYSGSVPLFNWLCGIARRKAADEARRRAAVDRLEDADRRPGSDDPVGPGRVAPVDPYPLPEDAFEAMETSAEVVEALWSLAPDHREALLVRYVEEQGVDVVAMRLGRTYKGAESVLSRAREALRRALEGLRPDAGGSS